MRTFVARPILLLASTVVLAILATGCSGAGQDSPRSSELILAAALEPALVNTGDLNLIMGTNALKVTAALTDLGDNSNFLPNANCLGIWQIAEKRIYGDSRFTAIRGQVLRQPDKGLWDAFVEQAAVLFPSAADAQKFFAASADRWSHCTTHTVNLTINDIRTSWFFGDLTRTDSQLTMRVTRNGTERVCQRRLSVVNNAIIDVSACAAAVDDQAVTIAGKIEGKL